MPRRDRRWLTAAPVETWRRSRQRGIPVVRVHHLKRTTEPQGHTMTDFVNAAEQEAAENAITQAEIVRLSLADQECFAKALLNPSEPMQALTRAFAHRDKLLSTEA